jgi:hypothetical protein
MSWGLRPAQHCRSLAHIYNTCLLHYRIMDEQCTKVEWESEEDAQQGVLSFAAAGQQSSKLESSGAGRHSYFRIRKIQRVAAF